MRRSSLPRPVSWLPRLHEIRRAVTNSVRSHYGRPELETLFELQPRAAGKLLEALPTVAVGTSRLVEREALARFLERVQEADDIAAVLEEVRQEKTAASRRRLRTLVQRDDSPVSLASLPESLVLSRGRLEVRFRSLEELAQALYFVARLIEADGEGFAEQYEPVPQKTQGTEDDWREGHFVGTGKLECQDRPLSSVISKSPNEHRELELELVRHPGANVSLSRERKMRSNRSAQMD